MKQIKYVFLVTLCLVSIGGYAQNTISNNGTDSTFFYANGSKSMVLTPEGALILGYLNTVDPSAVLQLNSNEKGFLIPRMTAVERDNILAPAEGLIIYNTTSQQFNFYDGLDWDIVLNAASQPWTKEGALIYATDNVDSVSIGSSNPIYFCKFSVTDETELIVGLHTVSNSNLGTNIALLKSRGTEGFEQLPMESDILGNIIFLGTDKNSFVDGAEIKVRAAEDFTLFSGGSYMEFKITPLGENNTQTAVLITPDGDMGVGVNDLNNIFGKLHVASNERDGILIQSSGPLMDDSPNLYLVRSRGDKDFPTGIMAGDAIGSVSFNGHNTVEFEEGAVMEARAEENFSTFGRGSRLSFKTTKIGETNAENRMVIDGFGNVGIGLYSPEAQLHVASNVGQTGIVHQTSNETNSGGIFVARSRGSILSPTALNTGDYLGSFAFIGHDGNSLTNPIADIGAVAAENFVFGSTGTELVFRTTQNGTTSPFERVRISQNGSVGIGTEQKQPDMCLLQMQLVMPVGRQHLEVVRD
jgi:hypothetical protein